MTGSIMAVKIPFYVSIVLDLKLCVLLQSFDFSFPIIFPISNGGKYMTRACLYAPVAFIKPRIILSALAARKSPARAGHTTPSPLPVRRIGI